MTIKSLNDIPVVLEPLNKKPPNKARMPEWIRASLSSDQVFAETAKAINQQQLHTVCEEARCPNRGECWSRGTATLMLLGDTCTRACGFCNVKTGHPPIYDRDEPRRVAEAVKQMNLTYLVLTSVNRDELDDGGAAIYAETLQRLRDQQPLLGLEVLTPDFRACQSQAIDLIYPAVSPGLLDHHTALVWGHNIETVPSLYQTARKGAKYQRSLDLLKCVSQLDGVESKSAIMLGLGETEAELLQTLEDLRAHDVTRIAIGQYLRPSRHHLPVIEYIHPDKFSWYAEQAEAIGFTWIKSAPMVRSSYHAEE